MAQLKHPPKITPADLSRTQRALDFLPRPENNNKCKLHHRRIQFASQEAVEKVGIDVAPVWEAPVVEAVRRPLTKNVDCCPILMKDLISVIGRSASR